MIALTQAQILDIVRRATPDGFVDAYLDGPAGAAVLAALQAVFARVSTAVVNNWSELAPGRADLGSTSIGTIRLSRTGTSVGTLAIGSVLWDIHGERVILTQAATFGAGDVSQVVTVESYSRSFQANLVAGTSLGVYRPDPSPLFDTTLKGEVLSPGLLGGRPAALDAHAAAKNMTPRQGETAAQVRIRLREVQDSITPAAILRHAQAEIPTATMVEVIDLVPFAFGDGIASPPDGAWYVGGSLDLDADFRALRPPESYAINAFAIAVPALPSLPAMFYAGGAGFYALTFTSPSSVPDVIGAGCYCAPDLSATAFDGSAYNIGNPGTGVPDAVARLLSRVESARAAGIRWWVEEV